jgi:hypothetical protein
MHLGVPHTLTPTERFKDYVKTRHGAKKRGYSGFEGEDLPYIELEAAPSDSDSEEEEKKRKAAARRRKKPVAPRRKKLEGSHPLPRSTAKEAAEEPKAAFQPQRVRR